MSSDLLCSSSRKLTTPQQKSQHFEMRQMFSVCTLYELYHICYPFHLAMATSLRRYFTVCHGGKCSLHANAFSSTVNSSVIINQNVKMLHWILLKCETTAFTITCSGWQTYSSHNAWWQYAAAVKWRETVKRRKLPGDLRWWQRQCWLQLDRGDEQPQGSRC